MIYHKAASSRKLCCPSKWSFTFSVFPSWTFSVVWWEKFWTWSLIKVAWWESADGKSGDSTLLKADQPVQFFSDLFSFRNSLQNCFLNFFADEKRGDSTLLEADQAVQWPSSFAIAMQLVSPRQEPRAIQRGCRTHWNTTSSVHIAIQCAVQKYNEVAVSTLQNNKQHPHCNTMLSAEIQCQVGESTLKYNEQCPHCNDHPEPCNWSVGKWQSRAVGSWGQESTALVIFAGLSFLGQYLLLLPCKKIIRLQAVDYFFGTIFIGPR